MEELGSSEEQGALVEELEALEEELGVLVEEWVALVASVALEAPVALVFLVALVQWLTRGNPGSDCQLECSIVPQYGD